MMMTQTPFKPPNKAGKCLTPEQYRTRATWMCARVLRCLLTEDRNGNGQMQAKPSECADDAR